MESLTTVTLSCTCFCDYVYIFFTFYHLNSILFYFIFCHLFLVFKFKFLLGGSKPVCISSYSESADIKMSDTCRHYHTDKKEHRLGQIYHVSFYLTLFISNTHNSSTIYIKNDRTVTWILKKHT